MHETYFGLQKRPFLAVPTLERYCPVASQEQAFQACHRVISRAEGPVAVLGGTGLGKSMVCLRIADAFRRTFEVILLSSSQICSRRALLQNLLFELRMPYRDLNEGELRLSLLDRLQPSNENPSDGLALIVDEAQSLSIKLLEELRMLTNLTRDGLPRVRLVLCGTHRLDEMLGHPQLESLNQRIAGRCYLSPLSMHETSAYITHKVERCGASIHGVLTDEAIHLVHRATDGVPRLIDQLCDQTLRMGAENHQRPCSASLVEAAWASLQQLPLPWSDAGTPIEGTLSSIEFGSLDDDSESEFADSEPLPVEKFDVESTFRKPAPTYNQPVANANWPTSNSEQPRAFSKNAFNEDRSMYSDFESSPVRSSFSPIPSAGMGLSGFGSLPPTLTYSTTDNQSVGSSDVWDDFLSNQRLELKPLEKADFQNESFPASSSNDQLRWLPDTVDYQPTSPIRQQPAEATTSRYESVPSNEQLFGNDFQEEVAVESGAAVPTPASEPLPPYTYDNLPLSSFADEDALAYDIEPMTSAASENSLRPYSELLDTLSSSNLEAMTFDRSVDLRSPPSYDDSIDQAAANFGSGLARSSRSTILSFADLQQNQAPVVSDDRDLLVIEEDLPNQIADMATELATPAVVHPYKQLFSKLRG